MRRRWFLVLLVLTLGALAATLEAVWREDAAQDGQVGQSEAPTAVEIDPLRLRGTRPFPPIRSEPGSAAPQQVERLWPHDGVVVDVDGRPVEGAEILAHDVVVATSGAEGRFRVDDVSSLPALHARARGLASAVGWRTTREACRLVLVPALEIEVAVRDLATSTPMVGAVVLVASLRIHTGPDGIARTSIPRPITREMEVWAEAEGHAPGYADIETTEQAAAHAEIVLGTGGTVAGIVLDARGDPVDLATVTLTSRRAARATTDPDGRFVLEHVRAEVRGSRRASLFVKEETGAATLDEDVDLPAEGARLDVTLRLPSPSRLSGRVVLPDGTGRAGLMVRGMDLGSHSSNRARATTTGGDGSFRLDGIDPRSFGGLEVASAQGELIRGFPRGVLASGSPEEPVLLVVDRSLDRVSRIVRVLGPAGRPVRGAEVWFGTWRWVARTDENGEVSFGNMPRGHLSLFVVPPEGAPTGMLVDLTTDASGPIDVRLGTGTISGRAVQPDGRPARVKLDLSSVVVVPDGVTGIGLPDRGSSAEDRVNTDDDGRFRFLGVGDGAYELEYSLPGEQAWQSIGSVRAGQDDLRIVVDGAGSGMGIEIEVDGGVPDARDRRLAGRSFDEPVFWGCELEGGLCLRLDQAGQEPRYVVLAPVVGSPRLFRTGRVHDWKAVPPGEYEVTILGRGEFVPVRLPGRRRLPATSRWSVRLDAGGIVQGRVVDEAGSPLRGVRVRAMLGGVPVADALEPTVTTDSHGEFDLSGLPDGEIDVIVDGGDEGPSVVPATRRVTVYGGGTSRLDFDVRVGATLEVWLAAGARLRQGFEVSITPLEGGEPKRFRKTAQEVADGGRWSRAFPSHWTVSGLVPGRHRVAVTWDGVTSAVPLLEVSPRSTAVLVIPVPGR